jgi:hypothetical protein
MPLTVLRNSLVVAFLFPLVSGCGSAAAPEAELALEPSGSPPFSGEFVRADMQAVKMQFVFDENHLLSLAPNAQKLLTPMQYDFAQQTIQRTNWLVLNSAWKYSARPDGILVRDDLVPPATLTSCTAVDRIEWSTESGLLSDSITPTPCGRLSFDYSATWQEVVDKTPTHTAWNKVYGTSTYWSMYDQFICHLTFAWWKPEWHLEPSRPNVGLATTIAWLCNPPL